MFDCRQRSLNESTPLRTQTQLDIYTAIIRNKKQQPTIINVLQLRILTNIFNIFKTQILMCYNYGF